MSLYEPLETRASAAISGFDQPQPSAVRPPVFLAKARTTSASPSSLLRMESSWFLTLVEAMVLVATGIISGIVYTEVMYGERGPVNAFAGLSLLVAVLFCGTMRMVASSRRLSTRFAALRDEILAWVGVFLFLSFIVAFSMKDSTEFSRGAVLTFFVVGFVTMEIFRSEVSRVVSRYSRQHVHGQNDLLLVGIANAVSLQLLQEEVVRAGFPASEPVIIDPTGEQPAWELELHRARARILSLARTARHGEIYVAAEGIPHHRLEDLLSGLQMLPRAVRLIPDPAISRLFQMPLHSMGAVQTVELQKAPLDRKQLFMKRAIDLGLAIPAVIFLAPLLCVIALSIKLTSRGPVIFRQTRLGHRSSPFSIFKFRTMSVLEDGDQINQVSKNDQRVTRVGRFLRRASLDELPQLFNVIKGQMSLVGPRPHARAHDALYATLIENYELRQHVKPGITGWAQVNGLRGETSDLDLMRQRVEHDMWYAKNASIGLDVAILFRTVVEVFRQRNAF